MEIVRTLETSLSTFTGLPQPTTMKPTQHTTGVKETSRSISPAVIGVIVAIVVIMVLAGLLITVRTRRNRKKLRSDLSSIDQTFTQSGRSRNEWAKSA